MSNEIYIILSVAYFEYEFGAAKTEIEHVFAYHPGEAGMRKAVQDSLLGVNNDDLELLEEITTALLTDGVYEPESTDFGCIYKFEQVRYTQKQKASTTKRKVR